MTAIIVNLKNENNKRKVTTVNGEEVASAAGSSHEPQVKRQKVEEDNEASV